MNDYDLLTSLGHSPHAATTALALLDQGEYIAALAALGPRCTQADVMEITGDYEPTLCACGCGEPATLATYTQPANGYRKGWPVRYIVNHKGRLKQRSADRDCGYVTPCHIFLGLIDNRGYGRTDANRHGERLAHRDAYVEAYGPIHPGFHVHHRCLQPACINPEHLWELTDAEHRLIHRPPPRSHCKHGHPYTTENVLDNGYGRRKCRTCHYAAVKRWTERAGRTCHSRKAVT